MTQVFRVLPVWIDKSDRQPAKPKRKKWDHRGHCKLTPEQVLEIRRLYERGHPQYRIVAAKYGVRSETIYKIHQGITWVHLR